MPQPIFPQSTSSPVAGSWRRGVAFGLATAWIWASWAVATRHAVTTTLYAQDLVLLRVGISSMFLWPLLCSSHTWRCLAGVDRRLVGIMLAGAGIPFLCLAVAGVSRTPASHMGTLMIGAMPVFVAVLAALTLGERFSRRQLAGMALVVVGIGLFAASALGEGRVLGWWQGDLLLLAAGFCFASYSVAQKKSGLSAWQATALVNLGSLLLFLPIHLIFLPSRLGTASLSDILVQGFAQGIWVAILGMVCYAQALRHLGAARGASFGALVPVITTLLGALVLGEQPSLPVLAGALLVSAGVAAVLLGRRLPG